MSLKMLPSILNLSSECVNRERVMSLGIINIIAHCRNIVTRIRDKEKVFVPTIIITDYSSSVTLSAYNYRQRKCRKARTLMRGPTGNLFLGRVVGTGPDSCCTGGLDTCVPDLARTLSRVSTATAEDGDDACLGRGAER